MSVSHNVYELDVGQSQLTLSLTFRYIHRPAASRSYGLHHRFEDLPKLFPSRESKAAGVVTHDDILEPSDSFEEPTPIKKFEEGSQIQLSLKYSLRTATLSGNYCTDQHMTHTHFITI